MSHPFFTDRSTPRVIAHRGWLSPELMSVGVVENSRASVAAAVELGVDIVESDCHLTADGVPILVHDADLTRVVGDPRAVSAVTERELRAMFADLGGLLTLREAFTDFSGVRFNIDVKAAHAAESAGALLGEYGRRALVNSFSDARRQRALRVATHTAARSSGADAGVPATASGMAVTAQLLAALALGRAGAHRAQRLLHNLDAVQIPERQYGVRVLTPALIRAAHCAGVEVHVWTVNDAQRMRELVQMGVDGIVTDRSDIALRDRPGWQLPLAG